jgi:hypothetical protein
MLPYWMASYFFLFVQRINPKKYQKYELMRDKKKRKWIINPNMQLKKLQGILSKKSGEFAVRNMDYLSI